MQLHELRPNTSRRGIKRIGRGGKRGTYSGKGQKGQSSRAGHKKRPAERDLVIRTPKLRGYKNKPKSDRVATIQIGRLSKISEKDINKEILAKYGFIKSLRSPVKIVGGGEFKEVRNFTGIKVSASVKKLIESAGGTVNK
jgi:large subunit ribosomal protein L15